MDTADFIVVFCPCTDFRDMLRAIPDMALLQKTLVQSLTQGSAHIPRNCHSARRSHSRICKHQSVPAMSADPDNISVLPQISR